MAYSFDEHLNQCRFCFKSLKNQRKATAITPEIEQKFLEWMKIELRSTDFYSTIICEDCDATFQEFSDFQFKMFENQTRLYLHFEKQEKVDHDPVVLLEMLEPEKNFDPVNIKTENCYRIDLFDETRPPQKSKPPKRMKNKIKTKQEPPPKFQKIIVRCELCPSEFETVEKYMKHMNKIHIEEATRKKGAEPGHKICPFCFKDIRTRFASMYKHIRAHVLELENNPYICDLCGYKCFKIKSFKSHMEYWHISGKTYSCKVCGKEFASIQPFRYHTSQEHKDPNTKYPCTDCGLAFDKKHQLYTHRVKVHEEGEYPCTECDKVFKNREIRRYHYKAEHTERKHCFKCGKMVKSGKKFDSHMRLHKQQENKRKCTFEACNREFVSPKNLLTHIQTVHGETKFDCPTCDASFATEYYLKRHVTCHNPDRVQCRVPGCTQSVARRFDLKRHYNRHKDIDEKYREELIKDLINIKMLA